MGGGSQKKNQFQNLDEDGIVKIGATLNNGDVIVNKYSHKISANQRQMVLKEEELEKMSAQTKFKQKGHNVVRVDKVVFSHNDERNRVYKVILREFRRPELGDKFSSRHGQKGIIGLIVNQEDMPFSERGWCPDLIMNPHGYPSRMTVGKLLELIGGKSAVLQGKWKDATAFAGDKMEHFSQILVENGYSYTGKDCLISGITGEYMSCYVYQGPVFYQRLKHMVCDKVHARARGRVQPLTRQPTEGRAKDGGLRLGEMERDCLLSYGSSALMMERLMISSDLYSVYVCENCGFIKFQAECKVCKTNKVYKVVLPYACKLLFQELMAMNIRPKLKLADIREDYI